MTAPQEPQPTASVEASFFSSGAPQPTQRKARALAVLLPPDFGSRSPEKAKVSNGSCSPT